MRRRTVIAAGLLAAPVVGCSDRGTEGDRVFRQFDPADQAGGLAEAVETWNAEDPYYRTCTQTMNPNHLKQFAWEATASSCPDIAQLAFTDVSFMSEPLILTPLDALMAASPAAGGDDLLASAMSTYDGAMWAV